MLQRHQTARKLRDACADGRLTLAELITRADAAHRAKTYQDLQALMADLPEPATPAVAGPRRGARRFLVGCLGVAGRWPIRALRPRVLAAAVAGEVVIDLCHTPVTAFETQLTAIAVLGEVRIVVPPGVRLERERMLAVLGYTITPDDPGGGPLVPLLRLRTATLLGHVRVEQSR